jgi:glycosyltransferase involved in cell wall biosynthesis
MESPFTSVIIPAYNQAEFLGEAIQSVLDQTYDNFELIVVDDASPDHTAEVVRRFSDPRIKYIVHQENRGLPATRNTGMRASSGELIALLDADDYFHPQKLQAHVDFFTAHPDIEVAYNNRFELNYSAKTIRELYRPPRDLGLKDFVVGFPFAPSDMVIRREWASNVDYFDERYVNGAEDLDFPIRLALYGCRFQRVDRALNYRRHHSGRRRKNLIARKQDWITVLERTFTDPRCPDEVKELQALAYTEHTLVLVYLAFIQEEIRIGREFMHDLILLSPSIFEGFPSRFVKYLASGSVADESLDHREVLKKIFRQLPPEMKYLSKQQDWAVGIGYLQKGIRNILWGRYERGATWFEKALNWKARLDRSILLKLANQIGDIEAEFGKERARDIFSHISPCIEKIGGKSAVRWLDSTLSFNRALSHYQDGKYTRVPMDVGRAFTADPRYLSNRGAWSILMRSVLNQVLVRGS